MGGGRGALLTGADRDCQCQQRPGMQPRRGAAMPPRVLRTHALERRKGAVTAVPDKRVPDSRGSAAGPSPVPDLWSRSESYSETKVFSENNRLRVWARVSATASGSCAVTSKKLGTSEDWRARQTGRVPVDLGKLQRSNTGIRVVLALLAL